MRLKLSTVNFQGSNGKEVEVERLGDRLGLTVYDQGGTHVFFTRKYEGVDRDAADAQQLVDHIWSYGFDGNPPFESFAEYEANIRPLLAGLTAPRSNLPLCTCGLAVLGENRLAFGKHHGTACPLYNRL